MRKVPRALTGLDFSHSNNKNARAKLFHSCCTSFIIPDDRFHRYPRAFYEEIHMLDMTSNDSKKIGYGFYEFIVLFGDDDDMEENYESVATDIRTPCHL